MPMLPSDLQQILDEIDAADRAGDTISAQVTDEQFHWNPGGGTGWSIGQCLDHLAVINVVYGNAMREGLDLARRRGWTRRGPAAPGFFGRFFIRSLEPPVKRKLPAPAGVQPSLRRSREQILRGYHDAHVQVRRLVSHCAEIDVNRATFQNPFAKMIRVKVSTGLRVIPAHDRRHLWQAEQVRLAPGFPPAR
jgi:DinB family protein